MIYQCDSCGKYLVEDDIEIKTSSYEEYYGVANELAGRTPVHIEICPHCGAEDSLCEVSEGDIVEALNRKE